MHPTASALGEHEVVALFLGLGILLGCARVLGELARRLGQPAVLGELLAGILLGPSVLGLFWPHANTALFPATGGVALAREALTTLGISMFLLVAGMEVDLHMLWQRGRRALSVAACGMLVPCLVGFGAACTAPKWLGMHDGSHRLVFALFIATALSISALPVIAKILMDLNLYRSHLGMLVMAAAVFDDLTGWLSFALVLSLMGHAGGGGMSIGHTVLLTVTFVVSMLTVGRWLLDRTLPWVQAHFAWPGGVIGITLAGAMLCSALTEWIGIHAIFGAFIFGVALGDSRHLREQTRLTLDRFISFFFAPLFFASIGLRINFVAHFRWELVLIVTALATLGKLLGCVCGARAGGTPTREAWAIGFGMNARGAMEIVLGLLALQAGLIREDLFVALVTMAMVTSMVSGTFIRRLIVPRNGVSLLRFLRAGLFRHRLQATDRDSAIAELAALACRSSRLDAEATVRQLWAREELGATDWGNGIAIPHARIPHLREPVVALGIAPEGIEFCPDSAQPVRIVCLLLTPSENHRLHLDLLADIGRRFQHPELLQKAPGVRSYTELVALLKSCAPVAAHQAN